MQDIEFEQINVPTNLIVVGQKSSQAQSMMTKLCKKIASQDLQMVQNQLKKVLTFKDGLKPVISKIDKSRKQGSSSIEILKKQSQELEDKINSYQKSIQVSHVQSIKTQIEANKKIYIALWENRISIASELQTDNLKEVWIQDRKSIANQLFKWIVVAIYGEAQNKFYLPNFKQQLFLRDQGRDFKQRLGKINAANAKQEQLFKVKDFLNKFSQIMQCEDLSSVQIQGKQLKQIAQIYLECHDLAKKASELQASIQKDKETSLKSDQEAMKWKAKHEALQQRIDVINQYLVTLDRTEKELEQKQKNYKSKQSVLNVFLSKLKKGDIISEEQLARYVQI